jgi:hypothetical protein
MSQLSDYLEVQIRKHLFRTGNFDTSPTNVYVALFTAAPSDSGGGTEVSGGAYARKAVSTVGGTEFSAISAKETHNVNQITFAAPSGADWGLCTHWGLFDAVTSGNLLFHGALTANRTINDGDAAPYIAATELSITFGTNFGAYAETQITNHWLRNTTATAVTNVYVALHTGVTGNDGSTNEVSGTGYSRNDGAVAALDAQWSAASATDGHTDNVNAITYGTPSASWGTISHYSIHTSNTGSANCIICEGDVSPDKAVGATDPAPLWPAGELNVTFA